MADHAASPEPEPAEPMKVPYGSDKLLSWVSVLWLLNAATRAAVAIREDLPGELIAGLFIGRDASAEFFRGPSTALSPGLPHIAAEMVFAVLCTCSGRAGMAGAAGLSVLGVGSTVGALGEKITYKVLSPKTLDPTKAAIVLAGIILSARARITILGIRIMWRRCTGCSGTRRPRSGPRRRC